MLAALLAAVATLAAAAPASAHPVLLFSDPALDGAVPEPPGSITLVFNEPVVAASPAFRRPQPIPTNSHSSLSRVMRITAVAFLPVRHTSPQPSAADTAGAR
ncbi:hypothetical protein [Nocardioides perillae]|uniref:CopC domain-containing protein n=1 Tax=Nocardioides perillae TaxID=1119534 RepID=A0A7Y9RVF7_9ACTN|nr:hypothetical protein [Nocardioides perillae]NYG55328.1 hypothetical protein [Nocardioides perillae]